ncbi:MAG: SRPBCC family protein, partial [Xanthobacteraceae bacterium]
KDSAMKRTHSRAPRGEGAVYEWEGNRQVGAGRIAITESKPPSRVTMALDMFRPFAAHNIVEFSLEPQGNTTSVTWAMHGNQPYMAKVMCMFMDPDKMVGSQFEEGLAKLKALAEKE